MVKKTTEEAVTEAVQAPALTHLSNTEFNRSDLNELAQKLNEVITFLNK